MNSVIECVTLIIVVNNVSATLCFKLVEFFYADSLLVSIKERGVVAVCVSL